MSSGRLLTIAVLTMLVQQSLSFMTTMVLPVAAPVIAEELNLSPALVGAYSVALYCVAIFSAIGCGPFIQRYGPLRVSQVALVVMGLGLFIATAGTIPMFALSALIVGASGAISTPASSELLFRYAPPRHAPVIFAIKQTGVPLGGILAGILVPIFILATDWRGAFVISGLMCIVASFLLQPWRARFDEHRQKDRSLMPNTELLRTVGMVFSHPKIREISFAMFTFVGAQAVFAAFFVLFLVEGLGYELTVAGQVFAASQVVAVVARIFWGWLASSFIAPRKMLALLGLGIAGSSVMTGLITDEWSLTLVLIAACAFSATAVSWHGVLLAEVARLAPPGQVGSLTGGVLSLGYIAMMGYPALYGFILANGGGFNYGFMIIGVPAFIAGCMLLRPPSKKSALMEKTKNA
ncbi:MAG: MFS transporter [Alphaproteobacteria bacterium]|nr:MFS transporter [Alphaproteobacteria bacterium]